MITSAVVFDYKNRTKRGQEGPIYIRVTIDRKSYYLNTGVNVRQREFVGGTIVDRMDKDVLNERVQIIRTKVLQCINEFIANNRSIDIPSIKKRIWVSAGSSQSFVAWVKTQLPLLNLRPGTLCHYETLLLRLSEYEFLNGWNDLTVENIYRWDNWLHSLRGRTGHLISDASVYNYHKCMKALLQRAVRFGILTANPYDRLRGEFKRGDKETVDYLNEDEMHRIEGLKLDVGSMIDKARDLFVFQMYTGLSYGDTQSFDFSRYRNENGAWVYIGERQKTGVQYVSRLLPPAVAVVEKYHGDVPRMNNADYNHLLKGIGIAANTHVPLHSHIARHTFATYMLNKRISLDSVSVMLGHTNTVQTRRYAKTLAQTVKDDYDKIAELLKGNNVNKG